MQQKRRSQLAGGLLLILLGAAILAVQVVPPIERWWDSLNWTAGWPLLVLGVGAFLLLFGLVVGEPGMAVPACIVGGIGGLLYWQNATDNWETWAYAWTLIPGFVGVGVLLSGLLGRGLRQTLAPAGWLVLISLICFAIFGSFLGGTNLFGDYWPALLVLLGLVLLARNLFRPRSS